MTHIVTFTKTEITKKQFDNLTLAMCAEFESLDVCFCSDSSGATRVFETIEEINTARAFSMSMFVRGFVAALPQNKPKLTDQ